MPAKRMSTKKCPGGHKLPKEGCSPLFCVDGEALPPSTALSVAEKERPAVASEAAEEAREKLSFALARENVRRELVPVPNLEGADAEEYIEKKKVALLPVAIAEIETQLRFGDDKARVEAARDVLRMNGMLNRDAPTGVTPTIVINMGEKPQLPWLQRKNEGENK
jgi:hypothetical protein